MAFNIKEKIDELVDKIKNDKDLRKKFDEDPVSAIEGLLGVDIPNDKVDAVVDGIKAKLAASAIGDKLGGLFGKK